MMWSMAATGLDWCSNTVAADKLSILIFHRVLPSPDPLFPQEMDAVRFDGLMGIVARRFSVLTLGQALQRRQSGGLPRNPLVITFDDGYADNAEIALPILKRRGLAATFFVSTGFLDGGRMWNDTVIECLRCTRLQQVDLSALGLGTIALHSLADRRAAIELLLPRLKYAPLAERERLLGHLLQATGRPSLPAGPMMRSEQVVELHRSGMEVGGHTINHPILTELPDEQAQAEIAGGKRRLEDLTQATVDVFAYPNGRPGRDYDQRHTRMVKALGFRGAVSTATGVSGTATDPYQLPRFTPWDRQHARWLARMHWLRLRGGSHEVVA